MNTKFKCVNGKEVEAKLQNGFVAFSNGAAYKAKDLVAQRSTYELCKSDFILDTKKDLVIPFQDYINFLENLSDVIGYVHKGHSIAVKQRNK